MNAIYMLHLIHHKSAFQRAQAVNGSQDIQDELLVILHVRCMYLQQVIVIARDIVTFRNFRNILYDSGKIIRYIPVQTTELYPAENDKPLVQFLSIKHGNVLFDVTLRLKPFHPLKNGSGRKMHTCRQFFRRQACILLQSP